MIAATIPYQTEIDAVLKDYVQFYVVPRLRGGTISKTDLDTARAMLNSPAIARGYSQSALTMIRAIIDQLTPYAIQIRTLSQATNVDWGYKEPSFLDKLWGTIKGGVSWIANGVGKIFKAGQTSQQIQPQVQLATSQVNNILSEVQRFFSTVGTALKGGAVSTGLSAFWSTTMGKVVVVGGGFLLLKMMSKR